MAPHILIIEDDIHLSQLIAAYLTKPLDVARLVQVVDALVRSR